MKDFPSELLTDTHKEISEKQENQSGESDIVNEIKNAKMESIQKIHETEQSQQRIF